MIRRFKVSISYDGSIFWGFQKLSNKKYLTVQGLIEETLEKILKEPVKIFGSGRTDRGVHALVQVVHFDADTIMNSNNFILALNSYLKGKIHILKVEEVDNNFHARFSTIAKRYTYIINLGQYDIFKRNYELQLCKDLDIEKIKNASKLFVGEHNFKNFCTNDEHENYIRNIEYIEILKKENKLYIEIKGNGFLRYMVRMIVGILIEVGLGRKDEKFIYDRLDKEEFKRSNYKANPEGLYLSEVYYE